MMSSAKIKRLEISTPQGEAGLLEKESRFVFNYTHPGKDRGISLIMPHRANLAVRFAGFRIRKRPSNGSRRRWKRCFAMRLTASTAAFWQG